MFAHLEFYTDCDRAVSHYPVQKYQDDNWMKEANDNSAEDMYVQSSSSPMTTKP